MKRRKTVQAIPLDTKCTMRILSARGDDTVTWHPGRVAVGDLEAIEAVKEAERLFNEARTKGATAFVVHPETGERAEMIGSFDPSVQQMIVVPRVAGGA